MLMKKKEYSPWGGEYALFQLLGPHVQRSLSGHYDRLPERQKGPFSPEPTGRKEKMACNCFLTVIYNDDNDDCPGMQGEIFS